MARFKSLLAVAFAAAIVGLVAGAPVAQAQNSICPTGSTNVTVHYVGAGSSAQFQMAAIAADQAALSCRGTGTQTIKHWSKKFSSSTGNGAYLSDNRNALIVNQTGNVWVVWIENSAGAVTDIWTDISVDSTVGVRCVLAQETNGSGCQVQITSAAGTTTDQIIPQNLWADNAADAAIDLAALNAINTSVAGGVHVNVGLTDIRPEDAAYATNRSKAALNATLTGLGYNTSNTKIGANIVSGEGTGAFAQPVAFSLPGKTDPFNTKITVPTTFTALPLGAAPIVFITNNAGTPAVSNLVSGVTPDLKFTGQTYPLAHLFDGSTSCDTHSAAFGGNGDGLGTPLTLFLREPLSGTMNTTEFGAFRTYNNTSDSQEAGVGGSANNPLQNLPCANATGARTRGIGTGEIVGTSTTGVLGTPNSIGYIFTGWGNLAKFKGSPNYQYLTVDGIDPIFAAPTAYSECVNAGVPTGQICGAAEACSVGVCTAGGNTAQTAPFCSSAVCTNDLWSAYTDPTTGYSVAAGATYPNVRYGLYKVWSIYRWITSSTNSNDAFGPFLVAQEAQNYVNGDVADFIPFAACAPGAGNTCFGTTGPTDGLGVFRSHFQPTGVTGPCAASTVKNGAVSNANDFDGGNTLGGGDECGGDVGGLIFGPYGTTSPAHSYVTVSTTLTKNKGYKITLKNGDALTSYSNGEAASVNGTAATLGVFTVGTTTSYYSSVSVGSATKPVLLVSGNVAHGAASATQDGTTYHGKHQ